MCGILGFIGKRSFDADAFGKALDVMQNRGPDDRGIYEEPECLLGHRRLATRYEYHAENFLAFVRPACIMILLRCF